jgi:iron complex outermembrane receptor protein
VQSGIEGGFDVFYGRVLSLHVTRFDQLASGLIQSVAVVDTQSSGPQSGLRRVYYQLQNVGEISNRGWELQSNVQAGPLSLGGALSFVQSKVRRVIDGYSGDLRPGDRMLEVPARTASASATWLSTPWLVSFGVSRAYDWVNYDRVQLTQDLAAAERTPGEFIGAQLRAYWRRYPGAARVRASLARDLPRGLALTLAGENLLGYQRGEPDNATVIPGRTISLGLRVKF